MSLPINTSSLSSQIEGLRSAFAIMDEEASSFVSHASGKLGQLQNAFDQLDAAGREALDMLKELKELATSGGFELSSVMRGAEQLKALNLGAADTVSFLREIGRVAAQAGRGSQEIERISRALAEMSAKTRLYSEEINQLGNAGVPVWQILSEATGRSRDELAKLVKEGKITSDLFLSAFRQFAAKVPESLVEARGAFEGAASVSRELEQRLESLTEKQFELSAAGQDGVSNLERFEHWLGKVQGQGRLTSSTMSQLKGSLDQVRSAAGAVDDALADQKRAATARSIEGAITALNRNQLRQLFDLKVFAGAEKSPLDQLFASLEDIGALKLQPGAFLPVIELLDKLKIASADDVAAHTVELATAIHQVLAAANPDLNVEQLGAIESHLVDSVRRAYEVMSNELTPAQIERNRLEREFGQLQEAVPVAAATAADRYRNVWQQAVNDVQLADQRAVESMIYSQARLADQTVFHATQSNAKVLDFLAQQKSVTEIFADARIAIVQKSFDGVDQALDRIIPKMHGFGSILKGIISDLLKLELTGLFKRLFGLNGTTANSSSNGGFNPSNLLQGIFGSKGAPAGQTGGSGFFGRIGSWLGLGSGAVSTPPFVDAGSGLSFSSALAGGLPGATTGGGNGAVMLTPGLSSAISASGVGVARAGGGAAAGGSSSMFGSLVPFLTNPFTIAAIGAAVGGFLLWRHFRHGTEKRLRDAIKSGYGIDVKDMQVLQQVKAIGEQSFGKGQVGKHLIETIKLGPVRDLLAQYAESTGQQSGKLVTDAQYLDPNYSGNRFTRKGGTGEPETGRRGEEMRLGEMGKRGSGEVGRAAERVRLRAAARRRRRMRFMWGRCRWWRRQWITCRRRSTRPVRVMSLSERSTSGRTLVGRP
jgi:tape measure domain-containing protein